LDLLNKYSSATSFDIPVYATAIMMCYPDTATWHDATTITKSKATTTTYAGLLELKNKMSALLGDVLNDTSISSSSTSVYDVMSVPICVYRYVCRLVEVCNLVCDGSDTAGYIMCKDCIAKHVDTPLGPLVSNCLNCLYLHIMLLLNENAPSSLLAFIDQDL
jgi:hypothetical protein